MSYRRENVVVQLAVLLISDDVPFQRTVAASMPQCVLLESVSRADFPARIGRGGVMAMLVDERVCDPMFRAELALFVRGGCAAPVVLVRSAFGPANEIHACANCVIARKEWRSNGWSTVRTAVIRCLRAAAAACVERNREHVVSVVELVVDLLAADPPFHSVAALAKYRRSDVSGLHKAWKRAWGPRALLTLGEFVNVVMLLSAIESKHARIGWRRMLNTRFHIKDDRLKRTAINILELDVDNMDDVCGEQFIRALSALQAKAWAPFGVDAQDLWGGDFR